MLDLNLRFIVRTLCLVGSLVFAQIGVLSTVAIAGDDAASVEDECGPEEKPCTTTVVTLDKAGATIATETKTAVAPSPQARLRGSRIVWRFTNISGAPLQYRFYAFNRRYYWPAANRAFLLFNGTSRSTAISCIRGEKVCYGAWVAGQPQIFYGRGSTGIPGCIGCCYICNGAVTKVFVLQ
jgi:hypothetical protein